MNDMSKFRSLKIAIVSCLLCFCVSLFSQNEKDPKKEETKWDKFVFGGNIGLQIGTITYIEVSPNVGYYFTPKFMSGGGLTYQYYKDNGYLKTVGTNIYGGRVYSEYTFFDKIGQSSKIKSNYGVFGHIEYEGLNLDRDFSANNKVKRYWLHGVLIGGGIKQTFGKHSSFNLSLLYNIIADSRTPYTNPIIRIGFYL
jgi:hypothetical protein